MDAAEQWEPDEARASRPVLRARGGEIPPRDSPETYFPDYPLANFCAYFLWDPLESTCRHASLSIL